MKTKKFLISSIALLAIAALALGAHALRAEEPSAKEERNVITSYQDKIDIAPDGSARIESSISIGRYGKKELFLPLSLDDIRNLSDDIIDLSAAFADTGEPLEAVLYTCEGLDSLRVASRTDCIGNRKILLKYKKGAFIDWSTAKPGAYGIYTHQYRFVNTSSFLIERYAMEIILPEGFVIHSFRKSIPAQSDDDPAPFFSLKNCGGRSHLFMKAENLSLGGTCMLTYAFLKKRFSWSLLVASLCLAGASLWVFRIVLRDDSPEKKT